MCRNDPATPGLSIHHHAAGRSGCRSRGRRRRPTAVSVVFWAIMTLATATHADPCEDVSRLGNVDIPFIVNGGQVAEPVAFYAKTFGGTVFVTKTGDIVYSLPESAGRGAAGGVTLIERIVGGRSDSVEGGKPSPTRVNSFKGRDSAGWVTGLKTFYSVDLGEVYDGIDLKRVSALEKIQSARPMNNERDLISLMRNI